MINVAHAQMAQFYQIPSRGTGSNTESKSLDIQAGIEKTTTLMLPALAGIKPNVTVKVEHHEPTPSAVG